MIAYNTEAASLGRGKTHATGTPAALWNRLITRLDLYPLDDDLLYSLGFRPCLGACHAYRHWTNFDEGRRKVWSHQVACALAASVSKRWPICTVPAEFSLLTSTYWNCSINRSQSFGYQLSARAAICCWPP